MCQIEAVSDQYDSVHRLFCILWCITKIRIYPAVNKSVKYQELPAQPAR